MDNNNSSKDYGSNGYGSKGSSLDCSSSNGNGGCWSPSRLF